MAGYWEDKEFVAFVDGLLTLIPHVKDECPNLESMVEATGVA